MVQDSRPDDLTKDEKIINADFEKLPSKTIKSSSVTEEILEENIQDEDREMAIEDQCFDSDKIVEETGDARGSGDEVRTKTDSSTRVFIFFLFYCYTIICLFLFFHSLI